jgi:hypothetical protein
MPTFGTHKDGTFTADTVANFGLRYYSQSVANSGAGSCATTTCHLSNSDAWAHQWMAAANYSSNTLSCTGCHGTALATPDLGTTGVTHLAVDAQHNTGTTYQCKDCHNLEAASGYTFTFNTSDWKPLDTVSTHGDGQIQVNSYTGINYNQTTGYCEGCHTSGAFNFADTAWTIAPASGDAINANCGSCHGYPPTSGDTKNTYAAGEGKGAHAKHISHLGAINANTDSFVGNPVCGVCHDVSTAANHSTSGGTRNMLLQSSHQFGVSAPAYNGTVGVSSSVDPKSCSNLDCHFKETPVWSPVGGE